MSKKKRDITHYGLPIIETHFHLDYLKEGSAGEILAAARAVGVEKFTTISVTPENTPVALDRAEKYSD